MNRILFILFVLVTTHSLVSGQSISENNILWSSVKGSNLSTQESTAFKASFLTSKDGTIKMTLEKKSYLFKVSTTQGDLQDLSSNGSVVFQVTLSDYPGEIRIQKDASSTTVVVDLTESNKDGLNLQFVIEKIQVLN
jgi:hypothetical protein